MTLNDLLTVDVLHGGIRNIAVDAALDALYDGVLNELVIVAKEADRYHRLSQDSVALLPEAALSHTRAQGTAIQQNPLSSRPG